MWIAYALLSAFFAGASTVLAKIGIRNVESNLATALRTVVVLLFAGLMVLVAGSQSAIHDISAKTLVYLVLSGLATGGTWLCYFKALQLGDMNNVVPVDRTSTVLTMIMAFVFLGEPITPVMILSMILITAGSYLMVGKTAAPVPAAQGAGAGEGPGWLAYALLSVLFTALAAILGKIGIAGVESNLGTAIRTVVVLVMAWGMVFMRGGAGGIRDIRRRDWAFVLFSGVATGLSWLFYYRALQEGLASVVVPIDRLGILVISAFGWLLLREKCTARAAAGLALLTAGTLALLV